MKTRYITFLLINLLYSFLAYAGTGNPNTSIKVPAMGHGTYELINSATDTKVADIQDGSIFNLHELGTQLNIRAIPDPNGPAVGSVRFTSPGFSKTESAAPYAYQGDLNGDYYNWQPNLGALEITVRYYSGSGASGTLIATDVFTITFIDEADTTPPAAPLLSNGTVTDTSVDLNWNAPADAVDYHLYQNGSLLAALPAITTAYTVTGLTPTSSYTFTVTALDAQGNESTPSNALAVQTTATPDTTPPATPSLSLVNTGQNEVSLSWNPVSDNVGVHHYILFTNGANGASLGNVTSHTLGNLNSGTTYSFVLIAEDLAGNQSTVSNQIDVTTAPANTNSSTYDLIDSKNNSVIGQIMSGNTYNLDIIGDSLNIKAHPVAGAQSVRFSSVQDNNHSRTESAEPYAYFGDFADQYYHWHPPALNTPITITIAHFSGTGATGSLLAEDEITMVFIDEADTTPPSVPVLSPGNFTETSVILLWEPTDDNRGTTAYKLFQDGALIATSLTPGYLVNGLQSDTEYSFTLKALDAAGNESAASVPLVARTLAVPDTTAPLPPTLLTIPSVTENSVSLNWSGASDNVGVTSYRLFINGGNALSLGNVTSYTASGLSSGTEYRFRVAAVDAAGNQSALSAEVVANTNAVHTTFATYHLINTTDDTVVRQLEDGITIDTGNPTIGSALNIDAIPPTGQAVGSVRFSVSDGTVVTENFAPYALAGNTGVDFHPWSLPLGTLTFTVEYFPGSNATGTRIDQDIFTVTFISNDNIKPSAIRPLISGETANSLDISWPVATDNVGVVHYRLFRNGNLIAEPSAQETSYTDTGLAPNTQYNYVIRAFDAAGNQSDPLTNSGFTTGGSDTQPPTVPTGLSGVPGPGSYTLNWTPSTDNVQVQSYTIHVQGGQDYAVGNDDTFTITGLPDLTAHTFKISAHDAAGNQSAQSTAHTGSTGDGTPPQAGTLGVVLIGDTFVELSLNGFTDNSGSIAEYRVFVDGIAQNIEVPGNQNSFTVNGLSLGETYAIHVLAVDPSENTAQSNARHVTTSDNPDTVPPSPPVVAEITRDFESITVGWSGANDERGIAQYELYLNTQLHTTLSGDQTQYTFTGLDGGTGYNIHIAALDAAGNSSDTSPLDNTAASIGLVTTTPPGYQNVDLTDENYVYTRTFQVGKTDHSTIVRRKDVIENISYLDGVGRGRQEIAIKQGANDKDIITPMEYDSFGRQLKEYLPYTGETARGALQGATVAEDGGEAYYTSRYAADLDLQAPNAHSEVLIENSPLNRPLKQAAPGESWKMGSGHEIEFAYRASAASEVFQFEVDLSLGTDNPQLSTQPPSTYPAGELVRTITYDENHVSPEEQGVATGKDHSTEEFTDKRGRVVLKRTYNEQEPHDTYYVYDDFNNLTFVLPPKVDTSDGVSAVELSELCYQYRYDHRNRLVEKKIPGKEWEYIVYNILDQPILTQDPNLEAQGRWLFTKYDAFGRVAYTGFYDNAGSREAVQTVADAISTTFEEKADASFETLGGTKVNYTNTAFPSTGITELLTISYYDNYSFEGSPGLPASNGLATPLLSAPSTNGLPTASLVKVLGTDQWAVTVTGYDEKRRPVYVRNHNPYLDALDIVDSKLDFLGRAEQVKSVHIKDGNDPIETLDTFTYDNSGRVLSQVQDLGGKRESIVQNEYDPMGLLVHKEVGGSPTNSLQSVDLTYNLRGWLTGINAPDLYTTSTGANRLFAFAIHYDKSANGSTPLFNGNIGSTEWRTKNSSKKRRYYRYSYDALNRIKTAITASWRYNLGSSSVPVSYDKNGNILRLYRRGHTSDDPIDSQNLGYGIMDNLTYAYDTGNKLLRVTDAANTDYGFVDGTNSGDDYEYDLNGNLTLDRNKGITAITYNHLNLPTQVSVDGNGNVGNISYIYMADGTKIEKIVNDQDPAGSSLTATEYCGNYVYERMGSSAANLKFFNHPEGYIEPDGQGGYDYIYQYKDHLGNIRLSYSDTNGNLGISTDEIREENNYYPFGLKHRGYNNMPTSTNIALKYRYNGKEEQDELDLDWIDYGWRNYEASIGRWFNIDPHSENYFTYSPFNYVMNMPLMATDPDGRDVFILFNREKGTLEIRDNDHYNKDLETVFVSAKDYKLGGIRDKNGKLLKNQILVIKGVFSGGEADSEGNTERDPDKPQQNPIPEGDYDLTEYEGSPEWFKVDPIDSSRYDDQHQGEENSDGETRYGYRLHKGRLSHGCITACYNTDNAEERNNEWDLLKRILNNTSTTDVPKREGYQKYIPWGTRKRYGSISVIGKDNVKIKEKNE
ncbi:fibronectin type III domain-containing protein [Spongiimicrobium salis]|uniref:fibronectin type III domain-containing protein n=1 Tax=Spongiimicrobium salis TaxID=1667022 RepID=UPI00374D4B2D